MKYESKLIRQILTSPAAKRGLDYITPIYGGAYVALWLMQALGLQTDLTVKWIEEYKAQILPQTATWSLRYFEEEYKIPANTALSVEQRRRDVILAMIARAPMNPVKLANILSLAVDAEISIKENTGKNTFSIEIADTIGSERLKKIKNLTDKYKPAHLIYWLNSIIRIEFYNKNSFLVKRLTISAYFLTLGLEVYYLDGRWNLDGTKQLQTLTKGPKLSGLKLSSYVNSDTDIFIKYKTLLPFYNIIGVQVQNTALNYGFRNEAKINNRRVIIAGGFGENENLGGRLIADNMWKLDGEYLLNSKRRLNAEIKEFDL